ncbi:MAG: EAL domain-containing protein [Acholeplasmatales bacterium]|nr:EAL domain-containing protein [Acholeplasmatales bacterium]
MDINFKSLLKLFNGVVGIIDKTNDTCEKLFLNNQTKENLTLREMISEIIKSEMIDPSSIDEDELVSWLIKNNNEVNLSIPTKDLHNKDADYLLRFITDDVDVNKMYFVLTKSSDDESYHITDPLTGLFMRNGIESLIQNEIDSRKNNHFTLILIDLDNFKVINDMYGHLFGDHILVSISKLFRERFKNGYCSRIGGDEFLILSHESIEYQDVWNMLHNLFEAIRHYNFLDIPNNSVLENVIKEHSFENFHVTITAGCARFPIDGADYSTLFSKCDKALYRGKRKGRNCYILYNDELHKNINSTREIVNDYQNRETLTTQNVILNFLTQLNRGDDFDTTLANYIKSIGSYYQLDRVLIIKHTSAFEDKVVAIYSNPDVPLAGKEYVHMHTYEPEEAKKKSLIRTIKRTNIKHLKETEPTFYDFLREENVVSMFQIPLIYNDILYGFIRFDSVREYYNWTEEQSSMFNIAARMLSIYIYSFLYTNKSEFLFNKDNLTGLYDYKTTLNKMDHTLSLENKKFVVFYTDLYKFRYYNDNYGYTHGDNVLRLLAKVIIDHNFIVSGRANGDHFLGLFEFESDIKTENMLANIISQFEIQASDMIGSQELSLSIGAYITDGVETISKACIDKARLALLSLSNKELKGYQIFNDSINERYQTQKEVLQRFKESINNNEFDIFLQPKIDVNTGKAIGAEALSRWCLNGNYVAPDTFIPVLESNGMISTLDLYVFENVLRYLRLLKLEGKKLIPISVNLAKKQSHILDYVDDIEALRRKYEIETKYIEIEITERAFMSNYDEVTEAIQRLRHYGYKIAMDDFGTGYSNLELLSIGLFDVVKFDKSLIQGTDNNGLVKILHYSIELAKSLGLTIVCEGVETEKQKEIIIKHGGAIVQGFYYSKPINFVEFTKKFIDID